MEANPRLALQMNVDDPVAIWDGSDVLGAFLNVGSNIFILPAVVLSLRRGDIASAIIYSHVFIASNLYHLCRAGLVCLYEFEKHQMTDYLFVYRAIIWTLTRLATIKRSEHVIAFLYFTGILYFLVEAKVSAFVLAMFGIAVPLLSAIVISCSMRRRLVHNEMWAAVTFALIGLAGAFMFLPGPSDYWWAHPVWHLFSMTASLTAELATFSRRGR